MLPKSNALKVSQHLFLQKSNALNLSQHLIIIFSAGISSIHLRPVQSDTLMPARQHLTQQCLQIADTLAAPTDELSEAD